MAHAGLKFGIFMAPFHRLGDNPTLAIHRDLELIEHLDRLGFDEAWVGEHHSAGWETIASPEVFIAAAIERTRHINEARQARLCLAAFDMRNMALGQVGTFTQ
jgi:limonene 1,2-monooxygenase